MRAWRKKSSIVLVSFKIKTLGTKNLNIKKKIYQFTFAAPIQQGDDREMDILREKSEKPGRSSQNWITKAESIHECLAVSQCYYMICYFLLYEQWNKAWKRTCPPISALKCGEPQRKFLIQTYRHECLSPSDNMTAKKKSPLNSNFPVFWFRLKTNLVFTFLILH